MVPSYVRLLKRDKRKKGESFKKNTEITSSNNLKEDRTYTFPEKVTVILRVAKLTNIQFILFISSDNLRV